MSGYVVHVVGTGTIGEPLVGILADLRNDLGMEPTYDYDEAIGRASVVIDCTPDGNGLSNKKQFYEQHAKRVKGFLAQGSEFGFGKPYAYGINDEALRDEDQFIQIVSCNTHNIAAVLKTLAFDGR